MFIEICVAFILYYVKYKVNVKARQNRKRLNFAVCLFSCRCTYDVETRESNVKLTKSPHDLVSRTAVEHRKLKSNCVQTIPHTCACSRDASLSTLVPSGRETSDPGKVRFEVWKYRNSGWIAHAQLSNEQPTKLLEFYFRPFVLSFEPMKIYPAPELSRVARFVNCTVKNEDSRYDIAHPSWI